MFVLLDTHDSTNITKFFSGIYFCLIICFAGQANVFESEGAGSDEEDERKGGMQKKDILEWLWQIGQSPVLPLQDYKRYRTGDKKGWIVTEVENNAENGD